MMKSKAQRLAEMRSAGVGNLPIASTRPGDPRVRRYTQLASMPFDQMSDEDFHVDYFGRLRVGAGPTDVNIRKRPGR